MSRLEDPAGREARHRDAVIGALVAAAALLALVLTTDARGLRLFLVVGCIVGGTTNAILHARREGWRWGVVRREFLFTLAATGILYSVAWLTGH